MVPPSPGMALIAGEQAMSLLEIHEVTKQFGGLRALNRVSCTVEQGQITELSDTLISPT